MGAKLDKERSSEGESVRKKVCADDFECVCTIGAGNYAQVQLVKKKFTGEFYAMKVFQKEALVVRDEVEHTRTERKILEFADHPFLVKMHYAFQTTDQLFIVMSFANGGELFSHLKKGKRFSEERSRFYAAEICLGLEYLHDYGVVYRDLKPENVLLDAEGHVVLTDFGLSKILKGDKTKTFCGTPEYLAPEVLLNTGHGKPVDWWAYGTMLYEMIVGIPPFYSTDVQQMYDMILYSELHIPSFMSPEAADILSRLLVRNPVHRLGSSGDGPREVMAHPFFKGVDWKGLYNKKIPPPFKPTVKSPDDIRNIDPAFLKNPTVVYHEATSPVLSCAETSKCVDLKQPFEGFTFDASGKQSGGIIYQSYEDNGILDTPMYDNATDGNALRLNPTLLSQTLSPSNAHRMLSSPMSSTSKVKPMLT